MNNTILSNEIFEGLKSNLKCDAFDLRDVIGFVSEYEGYSLNFYGEKDGNFNLIIDELYFDGKEISLGDNQKKELQSILSDKRLELEKEEQEGLEIDNYDVRDEQGIFGYAY